MSELAWGTLASPVGDLAVACSPAGVARVSFGPPPPGARVVTGPGLVVEPRRGEAGPAGPGPEGRSAPAAAAEAWVRRARGELAGYFAGRRRRFSVPVDWPALSQLQHRVLSVLVTAAGFGQTITYGALARLAGVADDGKLPPARLVGQVMGANPCPLIVPCHRVVAGNGLGGYSGGTGIEVKRWLLVFEGSEPPTLDWDPAGLRRGSA